MTYRFSAFVNLLLNIIDLFFPEDYTIIVFVRPKPRVFSDVKFSLITNAACGKC